MEVDLEGTLLLGMAVALVGVVTALENQTVLLIAMLMTVMMVAAMLMIDMVVDVIAILQLQIVFLVTDMVLRIVMHQGHLPGKEAMREMEDDQVEVITVMNQERLVVMAGVLRVWQMVTDMEVVDLLALVGVTEIDLLPMIAPVVELALMMTATDGGYLGADQSSKYKFEFPVPILCGFAMLMLQLFTPVVELALMMTATDGGYLGADQSSKYKFEFPVPILCGFAMLMLSTL